MPLAYYKRLSKRDQRIYRRSDDIAAVTLPDAASCFPLIRELERSLCADDRVAVEQKASRLVARIVYQLHTDPVRVRVRAVRPSDAGGELHGLYTWEEGKRAIIEVWMRTARKRDVVAFRTFLRTLLHEVCHHLDFAHFRFAESFHTKGFFRRESSLMRQLDPPAPQMQSPQMQSPQTQSPQTQTRSTDDSPSAEPTQLGLPFL